MSAMTDFFGALLVWLLWAWAAVLAVGVLLVVGYWACGWLERRWWHRDQVAAAKRLAADPGVARRDWDWPTVRAAGDYSALARQLDEIRSLPEGMPRERLA